MPLSMVSWPESLVCFDIFRFLWFPCVTILDFYLPSLSYFFLLIHDGVCLIVDSVIRDFRCREHIWRWWTDKYFLFIGPWESFHLLFTDWASLHNPVCSRFSIGVRPSREARRSAVAHLSLSPITGRWCNIADYLAERDLEIKRL